MTKAKQESKAHNRDSRADLVLSPGAHGGNVVYNGVIYDANQQNSSAALVTLGGTILPPDLLPFISDGHEHHDAVAYFHDPADQSARRYHLVVALEGGQQSLT